MIRNAWVSLTTAALIAACSSSTSPKPSLVGTWHVSVQGTLGIHVSPDTFSVTVSQARGGSYLVSMPSVAWGDVPVDFDSGAAVEAFQDTSQFGFVEYPTTQERASVCEFVALQGTKNSGLDTLTTATMALFNSDTTAGGYCSPALAGTVTIHK